MKQNNKTIRRITLLLTVVWAIVIFMFSAQPGVASGQESGSITTTVSSVLSLNLDGDQLLFLEGIIRKLAHIFLYLVLGFGISTYISFLVENKKKIIIISIVVSAVYSAFDEIHQLFVPGRSGKVYDVLIDSLGALLGILILILIKEKIRKKKG